MEERIYYYGGLTPGKNVEESFNSTSRSAHLKPQKAGGDQTTTRPRGLAITAATTEYCPGWGSVVGARPWAEQGNEPASPPNMVEAVEHDYSELTRSTCKALFTVFTPWVLFSSFVMTSFSSFWAFYSVFHSTLAGCCAFCAIVAFGWDRVIQARFALPTLFVAFCVIAPLASLPFLNHELAKSSAHWGGDFYYLASLILGGQIYWLLMPVVLAIMVIGPRPWLFKAGYALIFMGIFNFAIFICLISVGPLVFDLFQDAKLLFFAMLCINL